jgi:excisionase family DNA binding protein
MSTNINTGQNGKPYATTSASLDLYEIIRSVVAPLEDRLEKAEREVLELRAKVVSTEIGDKLLTASEAASLMKVQQSTIHRWVKSGKLKNYGVGKSPRISTADLAQVSKYTSNQK